MKQHTRYFPEDPDDPVTCKLCHVEWPCAGVRYRQSRCGCWQTSRPARRPWYYPPGGWTSWKPISLGGDQWCRRTLVLGFGWITGVLVIPLRECRGCEDCGPHVLDGEWSAGEHRPMAPGQVHSMPITPQPPELTISSKSVEALERWYDDMNDDD